MTNEITITLKAGKGYEAPWIVVKAGTVAEATAMVEEATGLSGNGMTLSDLTVNAARSFQSVTTVGTTLGAEVLSTSVTPSKAPQTAQNTKGATEVPQEDSNASTGLSALIAQASTKDELTRLYMDNRSDFDSEPSLMTELQSKAASL